MKKSLLIIGVGFIALFAVALWTSDTTWAGIDPNEGDLWYEGFHYGDSYFKWSSPGPWSGSGPGYEHDWKIEDYFFDSCTTSTNLPDGYDDCPTAGVREPAGWKIFSFGTYDANAIQANTEYFGSWSFSGGGGSEAEFVLLAQNVEHSYCGWDSIWCMGGVGSQVSLVGDMLNYGISDFWTW